MANSNPTPQQMRQAFLDHGIDLKFYKGWDTVGRSWKGPDGSPGLTGGVIHHTANPGAKPGGSIEGVLGWAVTAYELPVCNMLIGKDANQGSWLLSAGSVYHCGDGGPVPALGIPQRGFYGQTRLFGIEIDDPGIKVGTLTDYQIENAAKTMAALAELAGWDIDKSILTHKCYTDGCHGANPNGPSPCLGRKNDTIDGPWGSYPGSSKPELYNAPWWREKVKAYSKPATWDGTIPSRTAAENAFNNELKNKAAWRCACRLYDLGFRGDPALAAGQQRYPKQSMIAFQRSIGLSGDKASGAPNKTTWIKLFGKDKP